MAAKNGRVSAWMDGDIDMTFTFAGRSHCAIPDNVWTSNFELHKKIYCRNVFAIAYYQMMAEPNKYPGKIVICVSLILRVLNWYSFLNKIYKKKKILKFSSFIRTRSNECYHEVNTLEQVLNIMIIIYNMINYYIYMHSLSFKVSSLSVND